MDEHHVGPHLAQHLAGLRHDAGGQVSERLAVGHHVQVTVGRQVKDVQRRVEHLPLLPGGQNQRRQAGRALQSAVDGGHLGGLGAGAESEDDAAVRLGHNKHS